MATYKSIKYIIPTEAVEHTDSINALADVDTTTAAPNNGNVLAWSASASKWIPTATSSAPTLPTFTSSTPSSGEPNVVNNISITGSNFLSLSQVEFINISTGISYLPNSITFNNSTSLSVSFTPPNVAGNYKIRIENTDGGAVISALSVLAISFAPTFSTANGVIGTILFDATPTITVSATSDSAVTYAITSGALPTGLSLNSSTGVITGTETANTTTLYNFTITATDAESQTVNGLFSIQVTDGALGGAQFI